MTKHKSDEKESLFMTPRIEELLHGDPKNRTISDEQLKRLQEETGQEIDLKKFRRLEELLKGLPAPEDEILDQRIAYPNIDYIRVPGQRDTQKWIDTAKSLYQQEKQGQSRNNAINQVTNGWDEPEKYDFVNWLKFYESGDYVKYKFAQTYYVNDFMPGYTLPIDKDPIRPSEKSIDFSRDQVVANINDNAEKSALIEKQRFKLISRLDSVEKLLRSDSGQLLAGTEFENLIDAIYSLKKKVNLLNKKSSSLKTYQDMIIREANVLDKNGYLKAAFVLHKIAQTMPLPPPPAPPSQGSGNVGGLPSTGPGMVPPGNKTPTNPPPPSPTQPAPPPAPAPPAPPSSPPSDNKPEPLPAPGTPPTPAKAVAPTKDNKPEAIKQFLNNLETSNVTDEQKSDDVLEVIDNDVLEVNDSDLFAAAQDVPAPMTSPENIAPVPPVAAPSKAKPTNENISVEIPLPEKKNIDNVFDSALDSVTIEDVVSYLEDSLKIFQTRELPRRLSFADIMLDKLGLSSLFPSLSEATNKALESNNYILTRLEEIVSKLRGTMKSKDIDLGPGEAPQTNEQAAQIKKKLENANEQDKMKKQMRKDLEDQALQEQTQMKETPEIEIEEEPAPLPPAPAPVAPAPPPAPRV